MRLKWNVLFLFWGLFFQPPVTQAQEDSPQKQDEQVEITSVIGMTMSDIFSRFGVPQTVYAVRGAESWQDDVVFVYKDFDCYVYQDRAWKVGVKSAFGINIGDSRDVAALVLDDKAIMFNDCMIAPLPSKDWSLVIRVNFDDRERITALFIYRPDV
ncbi:MAG: hypothetical protein LBH75_06710 [Treponema sp.]|jgi:hypothetical protein|nr:hypothetical protein [Treponema sp.]